MIILLKTFNLNGNIHLFIRMEMRRGDLMYKKILLGVDTQLKMKKL